MVFFEQKISGLLARISRQGFKSHNPHVHENIFRKWLLWKNDGFLGVFVYGAKRFCLLSEKKVRLLSKHIRHDFQKLNLRVQRNHLRNKWENDDLLLILFFERKIFVLWEKNFGTFGEIFTTVLSNLQITCPVNRKTSWENFFGNWHF